MTEINETTEVPLSAEEGYDPPAEIMVNLLRQAVAQLNDTNFTLNAKVQFQVEIINGIQRQLIASNEALEQAGIPIPVPPVPE